MLDIAFLAILTILHPVKGCNAASRDQTVAMPGPEEIDAEVSTKIDTHATLSIPSETRIRLRMKQSIRNWLPEPEPGNEIVDDDIR